MQEQRISFSLNLEKPEHKKVFDILQKKQNRNSYIRDAIIYYEERGAIIQNQGITKEEVEEIIERKNEELLNKLTKLTRQLKTQQPPKQTEEEQRERIDKRFQEGQW